MDVQKYGQTPDEAMSEEMFRAREIVAVILDYGVTQAQIVRIVKLLGLELVDREQMQTIVSAAQSIEKPEIRQSTILT